MRFEHFLILGNLGRKVGAKQQKVDFIDVVRNLGFADCMDSDIQIHGFGGFAHIGGHEASGCADAAGEQDTKHDVCSPFGIRLD